MSRSFIPKLMGNNNRPCRAQLWLCQLLPPSWQLGLRPSLCLHTLLPFAPSSLHRPDHQNQMPLHQILVLAMVAEVALAFLAVGFLVVVDFLVVVLLILHLLQARLATTTGKITTSVVAPAPESLVAAVAVTGTMVAMTTMVAMEQARVAPSLVPLAHRADAAEVLHVARSTKKQTLSKCLLSLP